MRLAESTADFMYLQALIFTDLTQVESLRAKQIGGVKVKVFYLMFATVGRLKRK